MALRTANTYLNWICACPSGTEVRNRIDCLHWNHAEQVRRLSANDFDWQTICVRGVVLVLEITLYAAYGNPHVQVPIFFFCARIKQPSFPAGCIHLLHAILVFPPIFEHSLLAEIMSISGYLHEQEMDRYTGTRGNQFKRQAGLVHRGILCAVCAAKVLGEYVGVIPVLQYFESVLDQYIASVFPAVSVLCLIVAFKDARVIAVLICFSTFAISFLQVQGQERFQELLGQKCDANTTRILRIIRPFTSYLFILDWRMPGIESNRVNAFLVLSFVPAYMSCVSGSIEMLLFLLIVNLFHFCISGVSRNYDNSRWALENRNGVMSFTATVVGVSSIFYTSYMIQGGLPNYWGSLSTLNGQFERRLSVPPGFVQMSGIITAFVTSSFIVVVTRPDVPSNPSLRSMVNECRVQAQTKARFLHVRHKGRAFQELLELIEKEELTVVMGALHIEGFYVLVPEFASVARVTDDIHRLNLQARRQHFVTGQREYVRAQERKRQSRLTINKDVLVIGIQGNLTVDWESAQGESKKARNWTCRS